MTTEQALQYLIDQGISPERAERTVMLLIQEGGGIPDDPQRLLYAARLEPANPTDTPPAFGDEEPTRPTTQSVMATERAAEQTAADQTAEMIEIVEQQEAGLPMTEEQQQIMEQPGARDRLLEVIQTINSQQQAEALNYDWVYNNLQLRPGSLDSDESLIQLYDSLVDVGAMDDAPLEDGDKVMQVKELLARSPQVWIVQQGILDWAREQPNVYTPELMTDGVMNKDISAIMEATGVSLSRAVTLGKVAKAHDLDPAELSQIWTRQNRDAGLEPGDKPALRNAGGPSIRDTAQRYKSALDEYDGSKVLAAISISDPALAKKLSSNPYSLDSGEIRRALDYVGGGEGAEGDPQVSWLVNRLAGAYQVRAEVDDEAVRDAVQTLADSWNLTGSEGVAAALAGRLMAEAVARATAQLPNPFGAVQDPISVEQSIQDTTAHVKARLRQLPEYQELFGHKVEGESEEEYARRFENRSQQVLGDDVTSAVRAGMRSGNINTIYQQGVNTPVGDSSTRFQEIMARNARIFREML